MGDTVAELDIVTQGRDVGAIALLKRIQGELTKTDQQAESMAAALSSKLAAAQNKGGQSALELAVAESKAAAAEGDHQRAALALAQALASADAQQLAAVRSALQLGNAQKQQVGGIQTLKSGILSLASSFGLIMGGAELAHKAFDRMKEGFQLRADLEQARKGLGTFLGDVQKGDKIFATAIAFGQKYGFTQKEMGESARAAAQLMRSSTMEAEKQFEVLARLASLNPNEGFDGATFATKELASGDVLSLVERFNVGKDAAYQMRDAVRAGADVFQVMDQYLNKNNATVEILQNRMEGAAGAVRNYAQAQENMTLAMGKFAEGPGKAVLNFLAQVTNNVTSAVTFNDQIAEASARAFTGAESFQQYGERVAFVKDQIGLLGMVYGQNAAQVATLTQSQFNYAQHLIATGTSADVAYQKAIAFNDGLVLINTTQAQLTAQGAASTAAIDALGFAMVQVGGASQQGQAFVEGLTYALLNKKITVEQAQQALEAYTAGTQVATTATNEATAATITSAEQSALDATAKAQQAAQAELLAAQISTAANSFLALNPNITASGVASAQASGQISAAVAQYINMTLATANARAELARLQSQAGATPAGGGKLKAGGAGRAEQMMNEGGNVDQIRANIALSKAQYEREQKLKQAQEDRIRTTGTAAEKLNLAQKKYNDAVKIYGKNSLEAFQAETALIQERESATKKGTKGGGGKSPKLSEQEKVNNALAANQDKFDLKAQDEELKHQQALLKIQQEYAAKQLAQQKANEIGKRRSRYDFYKELTGSELDGQASQRLAQEYEAAFAKSQELAQQGKAKLASEYLKMRQDQIQQELADEQALAEAKKNKDTAEIQRLEQLAALRKEAEAEELKQLEEGGDQNQQEYAEKYAAEQLRYEEAQGKIAESAERAAQAKIDASVRAKKITEEETGAILAQNQALAQNGALRGGPAAPVANVGAQTPPVVPPTAAPPQPVTVKPGDILTVNDPAVVAAIADATGQLAGKLDQVSEAVRGVQGAVNAVEAAVGNIDITVNAGGVY